MSRRPSDIPSSSSKRNSQRSSGFWDSAVRAKSVIFEGNPLAHFELITNDTVNTKLPELYYKHLCTQQLLPSQPGLVILERYALEAFNAPSNQQQKQFDEREYYPGNNIASFIQLMLVAMKGNNSNSSVFFAALTKILTVNDFVAICKNVSQGDLDTIATIMANQLTEGQLILLLQALLENDAKTSTGISTLARGNGITEKIFSQASVRFGKAFCDNNFQLPLETIKKEIEMEWQENRNNVQALIKKSEKTGYCELDASQFKAHQFSEYLVVAVCNNLLKILLLIEEGKDKLSNFIKFNMIHIYKILEKNSNNAEENLRIVKGILITRYIAVWFQNNLPKADQNSEQFFIKNVLNKLVIVFIQTLATKSASSGKDNALPPDLSELLEKKAKGFSDLVFSLVSNVDLQKEKIPPCFAISLGAVPTNVITGIEAIKHRVAFSNAVKKLLRVLDEYGEAQQEYAKGTRAALRSRISGFDYSKVDLVQSKELQEIKKEIENYRSHLHNNKVNRASFSSSSSTGRKGSSFLGLNFSSSANSETDLPTLSLEDELSPTLASGASDPSSKKEENTNDESAEKQLTPYNEIKELNGILQELQDVENQLPKNQQSQQAITPWIKSSFAAQGGSAQGKKSEEGESKKKDKKKNIFGF